jgi:hypothetical protein
VIPEAFSLIRLVWCQYSIFAMLDHCPSIYTRLSQSFKMYASLNTPPRTKRWARSILLGASMGVFVVVS